MRFGKWTVTTALATLALCATAGAQSVSDSDFVSMESVTLPLNKDTSFSLLISLNSKTPASALSVPLTFAGNPNLRIDTTVVDINGNKGLTQQTIGASGSWTIRSSLVNNNDKTILIGYVSFGLPLPPSNGPLVRVHFKLTSTPSGDQVDVDSTLLPPSNRLTIVDEIGVERTPQWTKGVITIGTPQPEISLSPTTLNFSRVIGTGNPTPQSFNIANSGAGTLNWTAVPSMSWIFASPSSGSGGSPVNVSVNVAGLPEGLSTGQVVVTDPAASNSPQAVTVNLTLTKPTLSASPTSLSFSGQAGGANPAQKSFSLSASSSAAISWTSTKTSARVTQSPTSGTTPNTINVTPNIAGLSAGTYHDTITITAANAANSPLKIPITITLTQAPEISLSPAALTFNAIQGGANPPADTVLVTNSGGGVLDFTAATDQPWLSVAPGAGTAPQNLQVTAAVGSLPANTYTGHVIVTSGAAANSPETVTVTFSVQANPPVLDVSPLSMSFSATEGDPEGNPASTTLNINNTGGGVLNFTLAGVNAGWLQLSSTSGTAPAVVDVSTDPSGLSAGTYIDTFQVTSAGAIGSPTSVIITLTVAAGPPTIALAPTAFTFNAVEGGVNPVDQALGITNTGGSQALEWTASKSMAWLSIDPASGTAPSSPAVKVDISGLGSGTYEDTITVSAGGATNSPQKAVVTLHVVPPPPHIAVTPDSLLFTATLGDADPSAQDLNIANAGGGVLEWTATESDSWINLGASGGTAPSTLAVSVALSGLTPGIYDGEIEIAGAGADNSPVIVPVRLVLNDQAPALQVSPVALNFTGQQGAPNPPAQNFDITNTGGGSLIWSVSTAAAWISATPSSGVNDETVAVSVDVAGLSAGLHTDSILVDAGAAGGSPQYVVINFDVAPPPPPSIVLSPTSFAFTGLFGGANPASKTMAITNAGGRQLDWTLAHSQGWLSVTPGTGTAPSDVQLSVDISGLAVGTYYDTVIVSSDSADNSPQIASVRLDVVDNPPVLVVTPPTLSFSVVQGDPDPPSKSFGIANSGAGSLNWVAAKKSAWLSLSALSGTAPSTVDAQVATAGLVPGTYRDTVVITSAEAINSPQTVIVTLVVKSVAQPAIVLQPDSLHIVVAPGQISDPECMYVFIDGNGGRLIWRAHTDADWIDLSRDSCNISYPVCVTVDAFGFGPGLYCDSVEFSGDASNSPQFLKICMEVRDGSAEDPVLVVADTVYFFTAQEGDTDPTSMQSFSVTNGGGGTLNWNAAPAEAWVMVNPTAGTAPSLGTFRVDPYGLTAGEYSTTVQFTAPGALTSPRLVTINLTVSPAGGKTAHIVLEPTSLIETASTSAPDIDRSIALTNSGTGPLNYMIAAGLPSWLETSKTGGSAPDDFTVTLKVAGLSPGVYVDTIIVTSAEADNSPVGLPVMLTVLEVIGDVDSVRVGNDTTNPGGSAVVPVYFDNSVPLFGISVPLSYAGAEGIYVDSVSFAGTRVAGVDILAASVDSADQIIRIGVFPAATPAIPAGSGLLAMLYFRSGVGAPNQVAVIDSVTAANPVIKLEFVDTLTQSVVPGFRPGSLTIAGEAAPALAVSPDSLHFAGNQGGSNPPNQALYVQNIGGGSLSFVAGENIPWLVLSPASGLEGDSISVSVDVAGLSVGSYSGTIHIVSPEATNDSALIPVTLTVGPAQNAPIIVLAPDQLSFSMTVGGANPPPDTILVTNGGGGTLAWSATKTQPWLTVSPASGGTGTQVVVSINAAGLGIGDYFDTIEFTDPAASNSPRTALIELHVTAPAGPDTVFVASVAADAGTIVDVPIRIRNTVDAQAITIPLRYSGVGVKLLKPSTLTSRSGPAVFTIFSELVDTLNQTVLYGFVSFGAPMAAGDGDVLVMHFQIAADAPSQVIVIDTTFLPPSNTLSLTDPAANEFFPEFVAGSIVVGGGGADAIWLSEVNGEAGDQVTVDVYAQNSSSVERMLLPLRLTSTDLAIVGGTFTGTRSDAGTPTLTILNDQEFTIDVSWAGSLEPGSGPVAQLFVMLDPTASPQTAYVDTAGEYNFTLGGGSQTVIVPEFTRGTITVNLATGVGDDPLLPGAFALAQNYPNPFNPGTNISFTLAEPGMTKLEIFNLLGQRVVTLVDRYVAAGDHVVLWNGTDASGRAVPSGLYFYRLESGSYVAQMRMTLTK